MQSIITSNQRKSTNKKLILWWGSNILFTTSYFDWFVIKNEIMWKEVVSESLTSVTINIWWGENRDAFVKRSIEQWYCWIENLISIPWTVWAAPIQNIWAYGVEVEEVIHEVHTIDIISWETKVFSHDACEFSYRDSLFKRAWQRYIVTHVVFNLNKYAIDTYTPVLSYRWLQNYLEKYWIDQASLTPHIVANSIAAIREAKLPDRKTLWTAWSFFKNPIIPVEQYNRLKEKFPNLVGRPVDKSSGIAKSDPQSPVRKSVTRSWFSSGWQTPPSLTKLSAGQLVEIAWFKWVTRWSVGTYEKHALVLVHHGWGRGEDLVSLANDIISIVKKTFGVKLEPEVRRI